MTTALQKSSKIFLILYLLNLLNFKTVRLTSCCFASQGPIIFIFGPSCSGKSTLGQALQKNLGSEWTYIDRDVLIEQNACTDSTADQALEERIQSIKNKIIIDAQIPWREQQKGEFYFMLLPPLEVLLQRDAKRAIKLKRPKRQAHYARKYVLETHDVLSNLNRENFNHCFDSSCVSVMDEINMIKAMIEL